MLSTVSDKIEEFFEGSKEGLEEAVEELNDNKKPFYEFNSALEEAKAMLKSRPEIGPDVWAIILTGVGMGLGEVYDGKAEW